MTEQEQPGAGEAPEQETIVVDRSETATDDTGGEPSAPLTETEELAVSMGWAPPDKWRGPPESHRSAKEYILRTQEIARNLSTQREHDRREAEHRENEFNERVSRIEYMSAQALQRQREQIERDHGERMRYAASVGDVDSYDALQRNLDNARHEFNQRMAPLEQPSWPVPAENVPQIDPAVTHFVKVNSDWFNKDPVLTGSAIAVLDAVEAQLPNLPLHDKLHMVHDRLREEFPHKFNGGGRQSGEPGAAQVEGGLRQIRTTSGKGFDHLPPEAKTQASKDVKQGLYKDVHEWAKEYHRNP